MSATFSEAVQPGTVNFTLTGPGGSVPATVSYDSPNDRSILTPTAPLTGATTYTGHVSAARDMAGNQMAGTTTWSFTTADVTPPTVSATSPTSGATNVAAAATVTATYSEPVQPATVAFTLTDPLSNAGAGNRHLQRRQPALGAHADRAACRFHRVHRDGERRGGRRRQPDDRAGHVVVHDCRLHAAGDLVDQRRARDHERDDPLDDRRSGDHRGSTTARHRRTSTSRPRTARRSPRHTINLTGLGAHTTYFYRVTSVDASTNSATAPASPAAPATFVTNFATIGDTTSANFSAGTPGTTTYVAEAADGEVTLAPAAGSDFTGTSLPASFGSSVLAAGGEVTVSGGSLRVDGAWARTTGTFAPGRTLEFRATFTSTANQSVGLGNTLNEAPWAMFSTRAGGALRVSTRNGTTPIELSLGATYLGAPHTYRITWTAASVVYSVDGVVVATQNTAIPTSMHAVVRTTQLEAAAVLVDWLRLSPYAPTGTFTSVCSTAGHPSSGTARLVDRWCAGRNHSVVGSARGTARPRTPRGAGTRHVGSSGASINVRRATSSTRWSCRRPRRRR